MLDRLRALKAECRTIDRAHAPRVARASARVTETRAALDAARAREDEEALALTGPEYAQHDRVLALIRAERCAEMNCQIGIAPADEVATFTDRDGRTLTIRSSADHLPMRPPR